MTVIRAFAVASTAADPRSSFAMDNTRHTRAVPLIAESTRRQPASRLIHQAAVLEAHGATGMPRFGIPHRASTSAKAQAWLDNRRSRPQAGDMRAIAGDFILNPIARRLGVDIVVDKTTERGRCAVPELVGSCG